MYALLISAIMERDEISLSFRTTDHDIGSDERRCYKHHIKIPPSWTNNATNRKAINLLSWISA